MKSITKISIILITVLALAIFTAPTAQGQSACGPQYTVSQEDTLRSIAFECDTTVAAILEANPDLDDAGTIFVGQTLNMPEVEAEQDPVTVAPSRAGVGEQVTIVALGFPPNETVEVGFGRLNSEYDVIAEGQTNENGTYEAELRLPDFAEPEGEDGWIFAVQPENDPAEALFSNPFTVLAEEQADATIRYTVEPEDTLSEIALRFDTTVDQLLELNTYILDPGLIYTGSPITIPVESEGPNELTISPTRGLPGSEAQLIGEAFPAETELSLSVAGDDLTPIPLTSVETDDQGLFNIDLQVPESVERETAVSFRAHGPEGELLAESNLFFVAEADVETTTYIVQPEDILLEIANQAGISVDELLAANPAIEDPGLIYTGQELTIPVN